MDTTQEKQFYPVGARFEFAGGVVEVIESECCETDCVFLCLKGMCEAHDCTPGFRKDKKSVKYSRVQP
jgi:hypothetical protein